jgi:phosphatidate cytidylyltransferase
MLFVMVASLIALREFYRLAESRNVKPHKTLGLLTGCAIVLSFYHTGLQSFFSEPFSLPFPSQWQLLFIVVSVATGTMCLVEMFRNAGSPLSNLGVSLLGIVYVSLFFGTLVGIRELFQPLHFPMFRYFPNAAGLADPVAVETIDGWGGYTVIMLFACIWICDTAAYFVGLGMGKHKLFERVSPGKTWEGAIAGFVAAVATAVAADWLMVEYLTTSQSVIIGAIVGIFGQWGDLVESLFKRDAGVKDSSSLIPGHGGVLDRFDSLIFVSPLVYLYLDFIVLS